MRILGLLLLAGTCWAGTKEGKAALEREDYKAARAEFKAAAEEGDAEAHYQLGEMIRRGLGTRANPRLAARSYQAAAALGHKKAAGEFGISLWKAKKQAKAIEQLRIGVDAGHMRSQYWLAMLAYRGVKATKLATVQIYELFGKAAEQGHPDAQAIYASALKRGKLGGKPDLAAAEKWYRKAADQDHEEGFAGLASIFAERKLRRDALKMHEEAAARGHFLSQHLLALSYLAMERVTESYVWAKVGSSTKNAWPVTSKPILKLYKGYSESLQDMVKKAKRYTSKAQIKEAKAEANRHIKAIKKRLKAGRSWDEPEVK